MCADPYDALFINGRRAVFVGLEEKVDTHFWPFHLASAFTEDAFATTTYC
jgi:hypothetical protein